MYDIGVSTSFRLPTRIIFEYDAELGQVSKRSETPKGPFMVGH